MITITEWDNWARINNKTIYFNNGKMAGILNEDYNVF